MLSKGTTLFCEGDRDCGLFIVLDGRVRVVQEEGPVGEERVLAVHGRGRFVGDLSILTGQAVYVTAVAQTDVEVLEVLYDRLKEAVTQDQALGDLILRAFILRRNLHADLGAGLRIIGSRYSANTRALRDFASRNRIPCRWEDVEDDPDAEATLRAFDIPPEQTPVVIWKGQTVLRNPSTTELAELLGLRAAPSRAAYDLVVVGAGPGGLAAAVYAASEGTLAGSLAHENREGLIPQTWDDRTVSGGQVHCYDDNDPTPHHPASNGGNHEPVEPPR